MVEYQTCSLKQHQNASSAPILTSRDPYFIIIGYPASGFLWPVFSRVFKLLIHAIFWDQMSRLFIRRGRSRTFVLTQRSPLRCTPNKTCPPRASGRSSRKKKSLVSGFLITWLKKRFTGLHSVGSTEGPGSQYTFCLAGEAHRL